MDANFIEIESIEIGKLEHHPQNPRKDLGDLTELRDSIWQQGILQNLTVVPSTDGSGKYWVIIGNRRLEAARGIKGLHFLPCVIREDMDEKGQMKTMLCENMQRTDLTVYEQAQGFQLMMDLGASEEEIAKETGFSKKTVRQRLQMAKLDQKVLKEVSDRQIRLEDFDKLAKIENEEARTELLKAIGTSGFEGQYIQAYRKQREDKNLPEIVKKLHKAGITKIEESERYGNKYDQIFSSDIDIADWDGKELKLPPAAVKYDVRYGRITLYRKAQRAEPQKKTEAQIAREKDIEARWAQIDELDKKYEEKRRMYIEELPFIPWQKMDILSGLIVAMACNGRDTWIRRILLKLSGLYDEEKYIWDYQPAELAEAEKYLKKAVLEGKYEALKVIAYEAFGCHDIIVGEGKKGPQKYVGVKNHESYSQGYPEYKKDRQFMAMYDWLKELDYEMDDEEVQYIEGTHPVFRKEGAA